MSLSYNQHTDLSTNTFTFTFGFIDINDVFAIGLRTSDDTWVSLTITARSASAKTVTVSDDLTPYSKVQVYRRTTVAPLVDFQDGSRLTERDLDAAYRQGLYVAQEVAEDSNQSGNRIDIASDLIAENAITTEKILDHNVTAQKLSLTLDLSSHAVTLADGEIDTDELANGSVETAKLADDAVDGTKLADDAVNSEHLVDGSVDNVHLSGGIDLTTKVTGTLPVANGGTGLTAPLPFRLGMAAELTLPAADVTVSSPHLLGETPKLITAHLKCIQDVGGYSVGDIIGLGASDEALPYNVFADGANIYFRRDGDIGIVYKDSTTGHFNVTSDYFSIVLSAYA